jgi:hypothetical protein
MKDMPIPKLIEALEVIRKRLCAYRDGKGFCDCKFMIPGVDARPLSERGNGCPEIALAIEKLKEYEELATDYEETRKLVLADVRIRKIEDQVADLVEAVANLRRNLKSSKFKR